MTTVLLALGLGAFGGGLTQASLPKSPDYGEVKNAAEEGLIFPDGREYDFGTVKRGALVRHALPIVNRSALPLEIVYIKFG